MKKHIVNIFISLISIAFTLLAFEFVLRFTNFTALVPLLVYPKDYFIADEKIGHDIAKNFPESDYSMLESKHKIWSNNLGCFDKDFATSTEDYMLLVGDSFTWGYTPFEKKWGRVLEDHLKNRVLKCGVTGFGTKQELLKSKKVLEGLHDPKMIIVGYYDNDPGDDFDFPRRTVYEGYLVGNIEKNGVSKDEAQRTYANLYNYCVTDVPKNAGIQRVKCWLTNHSVVYQLVKPALKNVLSKVFGHSVLDSVGIVNIPNDAKPTTNISEKDLYEKHYKNILDFQKYANSKNSDLVFVLIPTLADLSNTDTKSTSLYKTEKFLESVGISYINLTQGFKTYGFGKPEKFYWTKDSHWNEAGNKLAGTLVAEYLIKNRLVNIKNSGEEADKIERELDRY